METRKQSGSHSSLITHRVLHKVSNSRTQLFLLFSIIFYMTNHLELFKHATSSLVTNIRMLIFGLNLFLVYFGVLFLPETSKSRSYGLFWRLIQSIGFTYALNVFALCFFDSENLQFILHTVYDEKLGKPLIQKDYAADCRLITPEHPTSWLGNLTDHIDIFVVSHFLGWMFKALIFRNTTMTWIMSIGFEVMEMTFEVFLPNFKECWWDHLFLDVFGCNLIGMLIGFYLINKFKMRKLHWFMEPSEKSKGMNFWQKLKYSLTSRSEYIKNDKWHWLSEVWTFNGLIFFCVTNYAIDLSYFFVKSQIHIPPPHWLFAIRIWVLAFFCILSVNDYYDYLTERRGNAMSLPVFLTYFIIFTEWLLFYKHMKPDFWHAEQYASVRLFWATVACIIVAGNIYYFVEYVRMSGRTTVTGRLADSFVRLFYRRPQVKAD